MLSALRAPSAWCRRSLSKRKSAKERQEVSAFARPSPSPSSSCSASPGPHADAARRRQRTSSDAAAATATAAVAVAAPADCRAADAPPHSPAPGFLLGDRHSHNASAGDAAARAPPAVYGNFAVVGPCRLVKLGDGSLLVTLPRGEGGGHVSLAETAFAAGGGGGGGGGGGAAPPTLRLGAAALAPSGRLVLHGELMQLTGAYRVARRRTGGGGDGGGGGGGGSGRRRGAVRRHCGGPALHSGWLDVLTVSALPVGAALVLGAGASLSHPLNATPPPPPPPPPPSPPCGDAHD